MVHWNAIRLVILFYIWNNKQSILLFLLKHSFCCAVQQHWLSVAGLLRTYYLPLKLGNIHDSKWQTCGNILCFSEVLHKTKVVGTVLEVPKIYTFNPTTCHPSKFSPWNKTVQVLSESFKQSLNDVVNLGLNFSIFLKFLEYLGEFN